MPFCPEILSFQEQIRLFAEAELVMGEFGSALHTAVFSPSSTAVVILANSLMNWTQSGISALRGQRVQYIRPDTEVKHNNVLSYSYRVSDIEANLEAVFKKYKL